MNAQAMIDLLKRLWRRMFPLPVVVQRQTPAISASASIARPIPQYEQEECWKAAQDAAASSPGHEWNDGQWTIESMLSGAEVALEAMRIDRHRFAWLGGNSGLSVVRSDINELRMLGPLFVPTTDWSWIVAPHVDMRFGLPGFASCVWSMSERDDDWSRMAITTAHQLDRLPIGIWPTGDGYPFEVSSWYKFKRDDAGTSQYVTIDRGGKIHPCRHFHHAHNTIRTRRDGIVSIPVVRSVVDRDAPARIAATISAWKAQGFHWIIRFSDERGSVRFATRPDLIRKLFANRDKVEGVRRATILHWVKSHHREGSSGVKTHLRGALRFKMRGFDVEIMVPGRHCSEPQDMNMITKVESVTDNPVLHRLLSGFGLRQLTREEIARSENEDAPFQIGVIDNPRSLSAYYTNVDPAASLAMPVIRSAAPANQTEVASA